MPDAQTPDWPKLVNIVELPVWTEHWDSGGKIGEYASDSAWEDLRQLGVEDLSSYIHEMLVASKVKWVKNVSYEDLGRLGRQLKDDHSLLESTWYSLRDAMTWAYEEAYTPGGSDIMGAMGKAASAIREIYLPESMYGLFSNQPKSELPEDWDPRIKPYSEEQFREMLADNVLYLREYGHYDRYIKFNWTTQEILTYIREELSKRPDPEDLRSFEAYLKEIYYEYLRDFEKALPKEMEDVDIGNRVNFRKHWKQMLADKDTMKHVAAEIKDYLSKYEGDPSR